MSAENVIRPAAEFLNATDVSPGFLPFLGRARHQKGDAYEAIAIYGRAAHRDLAGAGIWPEDG